VVPWGVRLPQLRLSCSRGPHIMDTVRTRAAYGWTVSNFFPFDHLSFSVEYIDVVDVLLYIISIILQCHPSESMAVHSFFLDHFIAVYDGSASSSFNWILRIDYSSEIQLICY